MHSPLTIPLCVLHTFAEASARKPVLRGEMEAPAAPHAEARVFREAPGLNEPLLEHGVSRRHSDGEPLVGNLTSCCAEVKGGFCRFDSQAEREGHYL